MADKEETRIFVGGLSWDTTDRELEDAFSRYGKVLDAQIMLERDTGRPRGFGFVTFADQRAMESAMKDMHGRELDGRVISVNRAQPKVGADDHGYGYDGGFASGGRGGYGRDRLPPGPGRSDCFKCGRPGHWARECPSAGGGSGGRFPSRSRFGGGGGRGDRFGAERFSDRYMDDRYDGGRYSGRDRMDRGDRYSGRDRYDDGGDRYALGSDRIPNDRYAPSDRYAPPPSGYGKDRGYDREGPRASVSERYGSSDRYGGVGPARYERGERSGPYDRPSKGARPPSYEDRY